MECVRCKVASAMRKSALANQLSNSTTDLIATADLVAALQRRRACLARPPNARYRCTNYGLGFRLSENPPQFTVPAELVARSRPAGHSVPIVRARQKLRRSHPYRLGVAALLLTLVLVLGMLGGVYYVLEAGSAAGYHLVCTTVGAPGSKTAHVDCHWEQLGTSR